MARNPCLLILPAPPTPSSNVPRAFYPQGEVGDPGQKGTKGNKGEHVSVHSFDFSPLAFNLIPTWSLPILASLTLLSPPGPSWTPWTHWSRGAAWSRGE